MNQVESVALLCRHLLSLFGNNRLRRGRNLNFNYTSPGLRVKFFWLLTEVFSLVVLVQRHRVELDLLTCVMQNSPEGFNSVTKHLPGSSPILGADLS